MKSVTNLNSFWYVIVLNNGQYWTGLGERTTTDLGEAYLWPFDSGECGHAFATINGLRSLYPNVDAQLKVINY